MTFRFIIVLTTLLSLFSDETKAQEFTKAYGNDSRNSFVNGYYSASHDAYFVVGAQNESTITMSKIDKNGNIIWSKKYSGVFHIYVMDEIKDPNKSKTDIVIAPCDYGTYQDLYVMRIDGENGNVIWSKKFKYERENRFADILVTKDQHIIASTTIRGTGGLFIVKLDLNGNKIWSKLVSGSNFQRSTVYVPDSDDGFVFGYILGSGYGIAKFTAEGNVAFLKRSTNSNYIRNIKKNPDGSYLLSGYISWETRAINHELIYTDENFNVKWAKILNPVNTTSSTCEACGDPSSFLNSKGEVITIRESNISGQMKFSFSKFSSNGDHIKSVASNFNDIRFSHSKYGYLNNIIALGNSTRGNICLPNNNNSLLISLKDDLDLCDTYEFTPRVSNSTNRYVEENQNLLSISNVTFTLTNLNTIATDNLLKARNLCSAQEEKVNLGPDISTCTSQAITLNAGTGYKTYQWSNGTSSPTLQVRTSGTYWVRTVDDCDRESRDTIRVTFSSPTSRSQNIRICQGGSYRIGNKTYTTAGTYTDTLIATTGCDSIIRTILAVDPRFNLQQNFTICQGDSVRIGNKIYKTAGTYRDTLKSVRGCDSIIVSNITVNPTFNRTQTLNICQGDSIRVGNKTYKVAGTYRDTLKTRLNCDSIIVTQLTVRQTYNQQLSFNICQGDSIRIGTQVFKNAGNYTVSLKSIYGCDSIIRANVVVRNNYSNQQNITLCQGQSIRVGNKTYSTTGLYRDTLISVLGCDSIIVTNLTINPTFNRTQTLNICQGDSIRVGNKTYKVAGTYRDTLKTRLNCDSIIVTQLTVRQTYNQQLSLKICQGDSIRIGTQVFKNAGNYTVSLKSIYGCDSIIRANITVQQLLTTNIDTTICQGNSVQIGNNNYTQTGTYSNTLISSAGCDSIVTIKLTVLESSTLAQSFRICKGDSVTVGTDVYTSTGEYTFRLKYPNGCDSILIQTSLTVDEPLNVHLGNDTILCDGEFITLSSNISAQNILWSTGSAETSIDVYNAGTYSVQATNTCGTFEDSILIDFEDCDCKVFIPNAFSPNGDGKNDVLIIKEENIISSRIIIYNKWGEEVFATDNNLTNWNGTYKNKQLSPDVYGYYYTGTCLKGNQIEYKGNITIVR